MNGGRLPCVEWWYRMEYSVQTSGLGRGLMDLLSTLDAPEEGVSGETVVQAKLELARFGTYGLMPRLPSDAIQVLLDEFKVATAAASMACNTISLKVKIEATLPGGGGGGGCYCCSPKECFAEPLIPPPAPSLEEKGKRGHDE